MLCTTYYFCVHCGHWLLDGRWGFKKIQKTPSYSCAASTFSYRQLFFHSEYIQSTPFTHCSSLDLFLSSPLLLYYKHSFCFLYFNFFVYPTSVAIQKYQCSHGFSELNFDIFLGFPAQQFIYCTMDSLYLTSVEFWSHRCPSRSMETAENNHPLIQQISWIYWSGKNILM